MSIQAPRLTTPTIILVGGRMTVDDGSTLDSRQPIRGDPWSVVTNNSLATSLLWWTTIASLVDRLLEAASQSDPFALVIGSRSIVEVRPDNTLRKIRLKSLLRGGTAAITLERTSWSEALPAGYQQAEVLRDWNDHVMGTVGFQREGSGVCWRFLDGNSYYLRNAGHAIGASVVVDTTQSFVIGTAGSEWLVTFEQERLFDDRLILVMPHTAQRERLLRTYLQWINEGRPQRPTQYSSRGGSDLAAAPNPVHYSCPVPVQAEFGVTGLIRNGQWSDGSELEAARRLLRSRFDLKIGIWDLVDNPTLKTTLLTPEAAPPFVKGRVDVPPQALRRAEKQLAARSSAAKEEDEARPKVLEALAPLKASGWVLHENDSYRFPLSAPVRRWPSSPAGPLAQLTLNLTKRATKVQLSTTIYNDVKIPEYLAEREAALAGIAAPGKCSLSGIWPTLLELPGGWADKVDWQHRAAEIAHRVPRWVEQLKPMCDQAIALATERREKGNPVVATLTINIDAHGGVTVEEGSPANAASTAEDSTSGASSSGASRRGRLRRLFERK